MQNLLPTFYELAFYAVCLAAGAVLIKLMSNETWTAKR